MGEDGEQGWAPSAWAAGMAHRVDVPWVVSLVAVKVTVPVGVPAAVGAAVNVAEKNAAVSWPTTTASGPSTTAVVVAAGVTVRVWAEESEAKKFPSPA